MDLKEKIFWLLIECFMLLIEELIVGQNMKIHSFQFTRKLGELKDSISNYKASIR